MPGCARLLAFSLVLYTPSSRAAVPTGEIPRTSVTVRAASDLENGLSLARSVQSHADDLLFQAGVLPAVASHDLRIVAVVGFSSLDAHGVAYVVRVTRSGVVVADAGHVGQCQACSRSEIRDMAVAGFADVLSRLRTSAFGTIEPVAARTSRAPALARSHSSDGDGDRARRLRAAGIAVTTLALLASATGIGLMAAKPIPLSGDDPSRSATSSRTIGGAALGLGISLLLVGIASLVSGRVRTPKRAAVAARPHM